MSSRSPRPDHAQRAAALVVVLSLAVAGCNRQISDVANLPASEGSPQNVAVTGLFPAGGVPPPEDPRDNLYDGDAHAINEGQRLFERYNCVGCHFHGAGGIGPALLGADPWRYGGRIDQIFQSIYRGRPNGMPAWAGTIPEAEIWEIAAYVRSLAKAASDKPIPTEPPPPAAGPSPPSAAAN
ncbi:MAG: cytochrome c [Methylobacteriaceae bacterium]|nr:cytochrome c [Methylobacteriaceae bacterium]